MLRPLPSVTSGDAFIFYGLLKRGAAGMPAHIDLERAGQFEGSCHFQGDMYDLGGFPGVVTGQTLCHGVIWRISDTTILDPLDDFEDVDRDEPESSLYWREVWPVLDETGGETGETAQIYVYQRETAGKPQLVDGNWPLDQGRSR